MWLLEAKMIISDPIDFLFGLLINLNLNAGRNKFELNVRPN